MFHRGEDPVGDWTIRVSDQNDPDNTGMFLGWNMVLWGEAIDPAKTRKYEVPLVEDILPPQEVPMRPVLPVPTGTKQHPKPTSHLPGDHGTKEGENSKPAFGDSKSTSPASPSATSTEIFATPDEGWFSDMSNLVSSQKWFFGAIALVVVFGIAVVVYFWRRRARMMRQRAEYEALMGGDVSMTAVGGRRPIRARELYDAFGEPSDDEDDADENTNLRRADAPGRSTEGLGFHSRFLDDDDPVAGGVTPRQEYRDDDPEHEDRTSGRRDNREHEEERKDGQLLSPHEEHSTNTSTSGEGSWEHA